MKILFIRHAESEDDLTDQYGGWLDLNLTSHGREQILESAKKIESLKAKFRQVISSPLARAVQSAEIIADHLKLNSDIDIYLKEKNGYGLLSGLTKEDAALDYTELVKGLEAGYVFGAEPEGEFIKRVGLAFERLLRLDCDLIAVTHGGFLDRLVANYLNLKYIKAHDGGFIVWDTEQNIVIDSFNFDFE